MIKKLIYTLTFAAICTTSYAQQEDIAPGKVAPELAFANPEGDTIKLSELTEKRLVLIDFWASWCGPCRHANPRLVKLYNEYNDKKYEDAKKGFTILSVSLDQNKDKWIAAIAKDSLNWEHHMSDLGGWNSAPAQLYGVRFIPQAVLVGPDGKIIAKYNRAEDAEAELKKRIKVRKKFLGII